MTDLKELRQLQKDLAYYGVKVTYGINEQGWIDCVFIVGEGVLKEYWNSVLSAAEYMRRVRHERHTDMMHPERTKLGQTFRNGRWREVTR